MPGWSDPGYGFRLDGSPKGYGYFGPLLGPGDNFVTELSASWGDTLYPLVNPNLTYDQLMNLMSGGWPDPRTVEAARAHAASRLAAGRSVWAEPGEIYPLPQPDPSPVQWVLDFFRPNASAREDAYRRYDPYR
jgi:hypothetical protein